MDVGRVAGVIEAADDQRPAVRDAVAASGIDLGRVNATATGALRLARLESGARVEGAAQDFLRLRRGRVRRALGELFGAA